MRNVNMICVVLGLAMAGCMTEDETAEQEGESDICRTVTYFDYINPTTGKVVHWDVTREDSGRIFVDEYGHNFARIQYSATSWKQCPSNTPEFVILRGPNGIRLSGTHLCLNDAADREELHPQQSYQRLFVPRFPFFTDNCP